MSIRQFNAGYVAAEDRVLLRVTLGNGDEYRFWLTRAVLRGFLGESGRWLGPRDETPAAAVEAFRREAALASADFATPLTPGEHLPLGEQPVLVSAMRLATEDGVHVVLTLIDGRNADFNLNADILAAVCVMLKQAVAAADWALPAVESPAGAVRFH